MKKLSLKSKKSKGILLVCLLIFAVGGFFIYQTYFSDSGSQNETVIVETKEKKIDDVFVFIPSEDSLSAFNEYITGAPFESSIASTVAGLSDATLAKTVIFAANNEAFETEEAGLLSNVPEASKNDLKLYYFAVFLPTAEGAAPNIELVDGQKLTMLNGREVFISVKNGQTTVTDSKGRIAKVDATYYVDKSGNRIYVIDNILLLQ
jgi:hypothetical protein